jgi:hypothetical protein
MSELAPLFPSANLKIQWAYRHGQELEANWRAFLQTNFCELAVERDPDTGDQAFGVRSLLPLPAEIPLLLGDAIHCLRCGLDHCINAILLGRDNRITFPMHDTREGLENSFRTAPEVVAGRTLKKGGNAPIEEAMPGIARLIIDQIQPYKGADNVLWVLGRLDNTDKHRLVTPVVMPTAFVNVTVAHENGSRASDMLFSRQGLGFGPMIGFPPGKLTIEQQGQAVAEMLFAEPGVIDGQPVIPALMNMYEAVVKTVRTIDEFCRANGWPRDNGV